MPRALRSILQRCRRDFPFFYGKALAEVHSSMSCGLLILLAGAVARLSRLPTTRTESHGVVSEYSPYRNPSGRLFNSRSEKHLINCHSEATNLQG